MLECSCSASAHSASGSSPGETGLFILGTTATSLPTFLTTMWLVTAVCAVAGDSVGYVLGKRHGPRLRQTKIGHPLPSFPAVHRP